MNDKAIGRRTFLTGTGLLAVAAGGVRVRAGRADQQVPFSAGTEPPTLEVPADACDCHMHIYDSRFPYVPDATLRPPEATVADYRLLQQRLGTSRNVVVTPSSYGTDNRCTLDAMAGIGPSARGVAVVDPGVADADLQDLDQRGIRGIRFNLAVGGITTVDMIEPLAGRVQELGWHLQINMPADGLVAHEELFRRLPATLVFDHLARIPQPEGVEHPAFRVIRGLLDRGRTYVKLSGVYLDTKVGPPSYADASRVAQALVQAAPERMLWGSDWPHPTVTAASKPLPDDAVLLDLLAGWAPDEATRRRVLVGNPEALYGFPRSG